MKRGRLAPDVVSHTAVIHAHIRGGHIAEAEVLLHRMRVDGPHPNILTYCLLLGAVAERLDCARAESWLLQMQRDAVEPSVVAHNQVIHVCAKVGRGGNSGFWRLTSEKTVWGDKGGNLNEKTL